MFERPSLALRVTIGKVIGFIVGLIGFILLPYFAPDAGWMLRWGVLFWYITFGAVIGMAGVFSEHPVLKLPLPWWFRSSIIGAWMNFVLVLFAYKEFATILDRMFGANSVLSSPYGFIIEGAIVGLIIGYFATRFGGEGPETAGR